MNATTFLQFRKKKSSSINREICEAFNSTGKIPSKKLHRLFNPDRKTAKAIRFVLSSFARPKDQSKARRRDGTNIAVHSLQLFVSAKYFRVRNPEVLQAVLVHDILEDTLVTEQGIIDHLGKRAGKLATQMTEETPEGRPDLDPADRARLSIVEFARKLRTRGDVIVIAELLDRLDDVADLEYLTKQLPTNHADEEVERPVVAKVIAKFGKCRFTVDEVTRDTRNRTVQRLKAAFEALVKEQLRVLNVRLVRRIETTEIDEEISKYTSLQNH